MHFIEFCLRNPVKVAVGVLLTVMFGFLSIFQMPVQLTPEVERPEIQIDTRWPGASPQEIEREIVQEQEEMLKGVPGVLKTSSESSLGQGRITLEFAVGTDMREALVKVSNRLQQVKEYPPDADEPVITPSTGADRPIAWLIMKPLPERDDIEITEYGKFAEDYVEARIERVPGVGDVEVSGGREPELQVVVDPQQLAARQLTLGDLRTALVGQNKDTSGGDFQEGKRRYIVRTRGQFMTPEQVENVIVAYREGGPVYVRDIGAVRMGFKKPRSLVRRVGEPAVSIRVARETGANVLEVLEGVQKAVEQLNDGVLKQNGLKLYIAYDERGYIYSAIGLVKDNIYWGSALTALILFLFLRAWRSTLVICLCMPISIIGTFLLMAVFGRTLNVISLAGLAFATGMVVDNAVVVLENIHRRRLLGESAWDAAFRGSKEVWGAVLAATLTTLVVYIPVFFITGEVGQLFRDIAIANSIAVSLSLIVAVMVIPVMANKFLQHDILEPMDDVAGQPERAGENGEPARGTHDGNGDGALRASMKSNDVPITSRSESRLFRAAHGLFGLTHAGTLFVHGVAGLARVLQRKIWTSIATVVVFLAAAVGLSWLMMPGVEYLPEGNRNLVFASLLPPPGYNTEAIVEIGEQLEASIRPFWEVKPGSPEEKALGGPAVSDMFFIGYDRRVFTGVRTVDLLRGRDLVPVVKRATSGIPGTMANVSQASLFERGSTGGRTIDVEIAGPVLERLVDIGQHVRRKSLELMPDAQVVPRPSLDLSSPEMHVVPRLEQAADLGLSARELGYWVDALTDGAYASDYWSGSDKIDLTIMAHERFVQHTQDLAQMSIATPTGRLIPVDSVADVVLSSGPESIHHRERLRAITIQVRPDRTTPLESAINMIQDDIIRPLEESGELSGGYQINLSGTADKLNAAWRDMRWNLILALLVTYLLMAGLFESWTYPAIIMISVPPAAVGGLFGLWLLNQFVLQQLDVLTMLGFITLIGIVVNNAILVVHQALNHMREEGMHHRAAIIESVRTRTRPIFMTTTTTIVGLIPLVVAPGAGSELYRGLGAVILGGLAISTLFTLILVPVVFTLTLDLQNWLRGSRRQRVTEAPANVAVPAPEIPAPAEVVGS
jgi:HAE1 family hydrophobic/amphiphilic exporter-1